jgi:3-methyladenine DNA glycosylase AlkD
VPTDSTPPSRPPTLTVSEILRELAAAGSRENVEGMARYGIRSTNVYGVATPALVSLARRAGRSHRLALDLWQTGVLEARCIAALVDEPALVTESQMEDWASDFDNWAVCDQVCNKLFDRTALAWKKAAAWSRRDKPFVKRAGFVLMATLAVHDKHAADQRFLEFLPLIEREATDERNFVRKAVNWALRQIGKRNQRLNRAAIATARRIKVIDSRAARWIASDALREIAGEAVQARLSRVPARAVGTAPRRHQPGTARAR